MKRYCSATAGALGAAEVHAGGRGLQLGDAGGGRRRRLATRRGALHLPGRQPLPRCRHGEILEL